MGIGGKTTSDTSSVSLENLITAFDILSGCKQYDLF